MNLDEMIGTWQEYDQKLKASKLINEKIILSMIREKSESTLSKMRRNSLLTIALMMVVIWFCTMSIIYNAFDYQYKIQFLPLILYIGVAVIFIGFLIKAHRDSRVDLYKSNLKESLRKVIASNDEFVQINLKLGIVFLSSGFLYLVSASVRVIQDEGMLRGVLWFVGGLFINFILLYIAHLLGAFKDHHGNKLKNHLRELEDFED